MDVNVEQGGPAKSGRARTAALNRLYSKGFRERERSTTART